MDGRAEALGIGLGVGGHVVLDCRGRRASKSLKLFSGADQAVVVRLAAAMKLRSILLVGFWSVW